MIDVKNLTKYFGPVLAVDRVSFSIDRGEIVGLLGLNGAGKTTTMRILTTYLPATSGVARLAGFDVRTQSLEVRRHIGYLPENVPLYSEMRVEEYLDYRAKLKGLGRKDARPASSTAWPAAASVRCAAAWPGPCPRATASAWASPTPWSSTRRSSSSMSRPPVSIPSRSAKRWP